MRSEEDDAENNAQASNNNVGDAKEVVATTHNGAGGDDDGLFASVFGCREDCYFIVSTPSLRRSPACCHIQSSIMIW